MRFLAFIAILCSAAITCAKEEERTHLGVFSNEAEGFGIVTVMIHEGGRAYFHAAVLGQICEWEFDTPASILSLKFVVPSTMKDHTLQLRFDKQTRTYEMIRPGEEIKSEPPYELHFIPDEIPDKLVEAFKAYPELIKQLRAQAVAQREFEERREKQRERDRPEYERFVAQIKADPETVLAEEFHRAEVTDLALYPPKFGAFRDTLIDHGVAYPEAVLVKLIKVISGDDLSLLELLFQRPELTSETLADFYPQALVWGNQTYTILAAIANHPNTPIEIVRDLAGRKELPVGATYPAQHRLEKIERGKTNR